MEKILKDKNGITYQLVGEVYYPILVGVELPMGYYAQHKIEYLQKNYPNQFKRMNKQRLNHSKYLFTLNCLCEQEFQRRFQKVLAKHPNMDIIQRRKVIARIKENILNDFVYQPEGVEFL